jgi:hypothetical protein
MAIDNNPLRQYFRRPAVYLKLPSGGKNYATSVINLPENGELPVYPMTAIDEITAKTPDALFNGVAMVELIKSCIPDIKDPWSITSIDYDAILISIRASSGGNNLEIESTCPKCSEIELYAVDLLNILTQLQPGDYSKEMQINDLSIKFRPLTYREMNSAALIQFEIQRKFASLATPPESDTDELRTQRINDGNQALKSVVALTMDILAGAIEYIQTPSVRVVEKEYSADFLRGCDKTMYEALRDHNTSLKTKTEIRPLQLKCVHCTNEYEQPFTLNTSDFFG